MCGKRTDQQLLPWKRYKGLLIPSLYELSTKIQTKCNNTSTGLRNFVILNIETDAMDLIESVVFNILNLILLSSSSSSSSTNSDNSIGGEQSSNNMSSSSSSSSNDINNSRIASIMSVNEAELHVRHVLPRNYADEVCKKAHNVVDKYHTLKADSSKQSGGGSSSLKFLRTIASSTLSSSSLLSQSSSSSKQSTSLLDAMTSSVSFFSLASLHPVDISQLVTLPLERLHDILCQAVFASKKCDIGIVLFITSALEFITMDILHLSSSYVRYLNNKYAISRRDVETAIYAEPILTKLFYYSNLCNAAADTDGDRDNDHHQHCSYSVGSVAAEMSSSLSTNGIAAMSDVYEDDIHELFDTSPDSMDMFGEEDESAAGGGDTASCSTSTSTTTLTATLTTTSYDRQSMQSDTSTICAESSSIAYEQQLSVKYLLKAKELLIEQNQHLNDLNILRRIFMYSFEKHYVMASPGGGDSSVQPLLESIFGNIGDVYECALRLADLLDDAFNSQQTHKFNQNEQPAPPPSSSASFVDKCELVACGSGGLTVGSQFWELAEGNEFDVYLKYSSVVSNFQVVTASLKHILKQANVCECLERMSPGLAIGAKYVLPKLLLGPVYHILYVFETLEWLTLYSFDDDDKLFLKDTLDTLKKVKFELRKLGFFNSRLRPVETSFRMFQRHQLDATATASNDDRQANSASVCAMSTTTTTHSAAATLAQEYNVPSMSRALSSNISVLTEVKWQEIERNVENNHRLTSYLSTNNRNSSSTIRYAYLHEGSVEICQANQQTIPKYVLTVQYGKIS